MINQDTISKIMETVRIEEVVGDFVSLKKRGTSLIGNCLFTMRKHLLSTSLWRREFTSVSAVVKEVIRSILLWTMRSILIRRR